MSYLWIPAIPIRVSLNEGHIMAFQWDKNIHRVITVTEDWRIDVEWWRSRVWRDYYRLLSHRGYLVVIYRDLVTDSWYLQRLYD